MRKRFGILCLVLAGTAGWAQSPEILRAAMYLGGVSSAEELTEEDIETVENARPVNINSPRLRPGVLLSAYQVASVLDYRSRSGDILSEAELSLVDGFSEEVVKALGPFLRFDSQRLPGKADTVGVKSTVIARATLKNAGLKAKLQGEFWRAGGAVKHVYGEPFRKLQWSLHGEWTGRRLRVVAGHFNVRYGLGLHSWTGFMMTSLSTVDAFMPRAAGIAPAWSYNPAEIPFGAAAEYNFGMGWHGSVFGSISGVFGGRAEWTGRYGQAGVTAGYSLTGGFSASIDSRWSFMGVQTAFEAAYGKGSFAGKASVRIPLGESARLAFQGRAVPSRFTGKKNGEYGLAAGFEWVSEARRQLSGVTGFGSSVPAHKVSFTLDGALLPLPGTDPRRLQVRGYATWKWQINGLFALDARLTECYRNYEAPRTDLRGDFRFGTGPWLSVLRLEAVRCEGWSGLGYIESGYKADMYAAYLRITGFVVDNWPDRIYVYERDAPGTFSVPAYYGRGVSLSAVGAAKWRFGGASREDGKASPVRSKRHGFDLRLNLRAAILLRSGRPTTPTLNLQLQCNW